MTHVCWDPSTRQRPGTGVPLTGQPVPYPSVRKRYLIACRTGAVPVRWDPYPSVTGTGRSPRGNATLLTSQRSTMSLSGTHLKEVQGTSSALRGCRYSLWFSVIEDRAQTQIGPSDFTPQALGAHCEEEDGKVGDSGEEDFEEEKSNIMPVFWRELFLRGELASVSGVNVLPKSPWIDSGRSRRRLSAFLVLPLGLVERRETRSDLSRGTYLLDLDFQTYGAVDLTSLANPIAGPSTALQAAAVATASGDDNNS
ncbi:hypothetical protein B0H14DRAFT_2556699 [Mycena olivaceomarginata]|nr:hypothetical protein B0H14DRAFT_2556699 [Mycena olivaceomarginata]